MRIGICERSLKSACPSTRCFGPTTVTVSAASAGRRSRRRDRSTGARRGYGARRATTSQMPSEDMVQSAAHQPSGAGPHSTSPAMPEVHLLYCSAALPRSIPTSPPRSGSEEHRQADGLELIASENFVQPRAILEAAGSVMTNKYAEGYPGRPLLRRLRVRGRRRVARHRPREEAVRRRARQRAAALGAQANMAVYFTLLKPGDRCCGMNLAHGGHLTHGHPLNFSGSSTRSSPTASARRTSASTTTSSNGSPMSIRRT